MRVCGQWRRMRRTMRRRWPRISSPLGVLPGRNKTTTGRGGVIDVDWQKTSLIVMSMKQRQLLIAVHNVAGVVDVEGDSGRRTIVAAAIQVDHGVCHAHHLALGWR